MQDEAEFDNGASLPEQLYFHTLLIDQVTKTDTQAFLEVEVEADQRKKSILCKVDTGAEGNVISLNSCKSLFPSSPCNPNGIPVNLASSSTTIVAFGRHPVVISNWLMEVLVNPTRSMFLIQMVQPF